MKEEENQRLLTHLVSALLYNNESINDSNFLTNKIIKILERGFDLNFAMPVEYKVKELQGCTLLHMIAKTFKVTNFIKIINFIISRGANILAENNLCQTPVHLLMSRLNNTQDEFTTILNLMSNLLDIQVKSGNATNPHCTNGISHFHIACLCDNENAVHFFLKAGVSVNDAISSDSSMLPGYTPIHISMRNKNKNITELLLLHGADLSCVNADGEFPLQLIFYKKMRGNLFRRKELLNFESDKVRNRFVLNIISGPNEDESHLCSYIGFNKLHKFCIEKHNAGDIENVEKFLNLANVNSPVNFDSLLWPGFTALHFAAQNDLEIVKQLLKNGANPLAKNACGITPLDICRQEFGLRTVGIILEMQSELRSIKLRDGKKLVDVIATLDSINKLRDYLSTADVNNGIPVDSALWPGYSLLHLAVLTSDGNLVKLCLEYGADYRMTDAKNMTALHLAFQLNNRGCIDSILEAHDIISANPVDSNNLSHFHIACMTSNARIAGKFLQFGVDPNAPTTVGYIMKKCSHSEDDTKIPAGSTAFHIAAAVKSEDLLKILVESTADPNLCDAEGFTWVHRVSFQRAPDLNKYLWRHPEALRSNPIAPGGLSHLHIACCAGDVQAVKALLSLTVNINESVNSDISKFFKHKYAESTGFFEFMYPKYLFVGDTPLHLAIRSCQCSEEIIDLLLKNGADVTIKNSKGENPVYDCCYLHKNHSKECSVVLKRLILEFKNKGKSSGGLTRLHFACALNDVDFMKQILEEDENFNSQIDPDSQMWPGCAPLNVLLENNVFQYPLKSESITLLLEKYLDLVESPVYSKVNEISERARIFLSISQDLVINNHGLTAFHVSCMGSDPKIVKRFITSGVDINVKTDFESNCLEAGFTPLHYAVIRGSETVLLTLIENKNIILSIEDARGNTPVHIAIQEKSPKFKYFLRFNKLDFCKNVFGESFFDFIHESNIFVNFDSYERKKLSTIVSEHSTDLPIMFKYISILARSIGMKPGETSDDFLNLIEQIPNISEVLRSTAHFTKRSVMHYLVPFFFLENDRLLNFVHFFTNNINVLLKKGCELDHQDIDKRTVFHYAVYFKQPLIIEALIELGADINITDSVGLTPYTYIYQTRQWDKWDDYTSLRQSVVRPLERHMERLQAAGLYMNSINEMYYKANMQRRDRRIVNLFKRELHAMDQTEVHKSITVRTLLTENLILNFPNFSCLKRRHLRKYLISDQLHETYPEWSPYFKLQSRKIKISERLFEPAYDSLESLLDYDLPTHCLESILKYLNLDDWESLKRL